MRSVREFIVPSFLRLPDERVLRMGYLDRQAPSVTDLLPAIISLESRSSASGERIALIQAASTTATHVIPSYAILSKTSGWAPWSWVRRVMVEEVYARARVVFPDRGNAPAAVDDKFVIRLSTNQALIWSALCTLPSRLLYNATRSTTVSQISRDRGSQRNRIATQLDV